MKWTDLTDMLFCRAYDHMFIIQKPQYRNDIIYWYCVDNGSNTIAEGKTIRLTEAKELCKALYKQLKQATKTIHVKANGKLVYR